MTLTLIRQRSDESEPAAPGSGGWRGRLVYMMGIMTIEPMMFVQVTELSQNRLWMLTFVLLYANNNIDNELGSGGWNIGDCYRSNDSI